MTSNSNDKPLATKKLDSSTNKARTLLVSGSQLRLGDTKRECWNCANNSNRFTKSRSSVMTGVIDIICDDCGALYGAHEEVSDDE